MIMSAVLLMAIFVIVSSGISSATPIPVISENTRILIIGAGMAGLSAAERLQELGFHNYTILEAKDYIGGRIRTTKFGDGWVEFGAQWIHGEKNNVIYEYASRYGLIDIEKSKRDEDWVNGDFRSEDGKQINETVAKEIVILLRNSLDELQKSNATYKRTSINDFLKAVIDGDKLRGQVDDVTKGKLVNWYKRVVCTIDGCYSVADMLADSYKYYEECDGDKSINLKNGYSSVVEAIHSRLRNDTVTLKSPVKTIELLSPSNDDDQKQFSAIGDGLNITKPVVVVTTKNNIRYVTDHVILTVSLGELRNSLTAITFSPTLSETKLKAIHNMGFGTVDKIFLEFDRPFWPLDENFTGYNLVSDSHYNRDSSAACSVVGFYPSLFASNVLIGWLSGQEANDMEKAEDSRVRDDCYHTLKKFTGIKELPRVKSMRRTKWKAEDYIRGSYSFLKSEGATPSVANDVLAEPIYANPKNNTNKQQYPAIMFAGEATHAKYFSTVHGARESGIRAANLIGDFYKPASTSKAFLTVASTHVVPIAVGVGFYVRAFIYW